MKTATASLVIVSLFVFHGCAKHSSYALTQDSPADVLLDRLRHLYPNRFTMYHRVILTVRGKNYDFNGFLTREGDHISAVGFNDLGGRLFHITSAPQKVEVLSKPDRMPAKVLRNGVGPEFSAMFSASISNTARSVQGMNNRIVLIEERKNIEYLFSPDLQRCQTIIISEGGERISFIQLRDYRIFPGWNRDIPQTMKVSNRKWNYEMTLRLLQIKSS